MFFYKYIINLQTNTIIYATNLYYAAKSNFLKHIDFSINWLTTIKKQNLVSHSWVYLNIN